MIRLGTAQVALTLAPAGGRIVSLVDLRSGRDWVHDWSADQPGADDDVYDATTAGGWDECLPTVAASGADCPPWGRLRDHGEVWGRPADIISHDAASCILGWTVGPLEFRRSLRLAGDRIDLDYRLANRGPNPVPWLYSQHALLAVNPGDRIALSGVGPLTPAWTSGPAFSHLPQDAVWPNGLTATEELSGRDWAAKLFAPATGDITARLASDDGAISFSWRADGPLRHFGLWLNHGGWPMGGGLHHIAFEPATSACDGLADAIARGVAPVLGPGQAIGWTVTVGLHHPDDSAAGVA